MSRTKTIVFIAILSLLVTACSGGSNSISQVTSLPDPTDTPTPTAAVAEATVAEATVAEEEAPTNTDAPDEPTLTPTVEPTTLLKATIEAATAISVSDDDNATTRSTGGNNFALATPTPQDNRLEPGEARAIALATDTVMQPEIEEPLVFDGQPVPIQFSEFYNGFSMRTGLILSEKLMSLDGQQVVMEGYVAPPLKPRLDFFVLTRIQLAFCPFCSTDTEWPDDIALVYLPEQQIISTEYPVRITGQMEIGTSVDAETGMVSVVRIYVDTMETLN